LIALRVATSHQGRLCTTMPSKKKAHSQARKAKKEAKQAASSTDSGIAALDGSSCGDVELPENRTLDDFNTQ
jgi:hypothetical protein